MRREGESAASMTPKNAQCKKGSRSGAYFGNPAEHQAWLRRRDSTLRNVPGAPWLCVAPGRAHDECAQGGRAKGGRASSGSHGGGGRPAARRRCPQGGALRTAGSSLSPPSLTALPWCSGRRRGPRLASVFAPPSARLPRPPAPAREVGRVRRVAGSRQCQRLWRRKMYCRCATAARRPCQGGRAGGRAGGDAAQRQLPPRDAGEPSSCGGRSL